MEIIDANWISERLTGKRGERAALATALGVSNDIVTKILKGERRVQPHEMALVKAHFERLDQSTGPARDPALEQKLRDRIEQLSDEERRFLLAASDGLIAHRQPEGS